MERRRIGNKIQKRRWKRKKIKTKENELESNQEEGKMPWVGRGSNAQ
jgi:hypothetical protein